ncbi:alanine/glycine:cation symporter family protein [Mycoplasma sp. P36-A1]|uniref:alanine/glycine:cation symporter family protein n=1 Tax=Mycoplasma sp. P36-A1 TaxID=3252900 RepID=UPI003C3039BF
MKELFEQVNKLFEFLGPISNLMWEFPRNFEWYTKIPILGEFTFAILLLIGAGILFTFKLGFVQVRYFKKSIDILKRKEQSDTGLSPMAAFLLSSATRIGPGNIMGVTGAITTGGPGALFWMWVSAFFGMATSFVEATLSQIFKEKKDDTYVGGIAYYGRRLLGNYKIFGALIALAYIVYALFTLPGQVFHMFTAFGGVASRITGVTYGRTDLVYIIIGVLIIVTTIPIVFGGIKRVAKITDVMVPIMAIVYFLIAFILIIINYDKIPLFFTSVIGGAFSPQAMFGGAFGIAMQQGIKRGLMSNEAGQGTITMAAASSDAKHPVEQGFVQSFGVFVDTFVICTISGFLVVIAQIWNVNGIDFAGMVDSKLDVYNTSLAVLSPGILEEPVQVIMSFCYGLFAFSTVLGMIAFIDICASEISKTKGFSIFTKLISSGVFVPFGVVCVWTGMELDNIWVISDFVNVMMVFINVPLVLLGIRYVKKALKHYEKNDGSKFTGSVIGQELTYWDNIDNNE